MITSNFAKKSLLMILSNIATSILGFIFSIVLSNELGPEGLGLFGLVRPINRVFLCIACGGIFTAVSKLSADYYGKKDYRNFKRSIQTTFTFTLVWSVFIAFLLFILAPFISSYIIRDERTINAIRLLSPTLVLIALSSTVRGYFISTFKIAVPMIIDIIEKIIKISLLFFIVGNIKNADLTATVTTAYFALFIGEFISFILVYVYYKISLQRVPQSISRSENRAQLLYDTLSISFPLQITSLISSILSTFSTLIVPRRLVSAGLEYHSALGLIGKYNGMAKNIPFFPMVIIDSIAILLIPDISTNLSNRNHKSVANRISKILELSFLLGAATLVISLCIGDSLGYLLYKRKDLGSYIKFASLSAPILYASSTTFAILNGLGKQKVILRNSIIISVLRIILLYILTGIPSINVYGYGITIIITSLISLTLNLVEILKVSKINLDIFDISIDVLIVTLTYFLLVFLTRMLPIKSITISCIIVIIFGFSIVFLLKKFIKSCKE